VNGILHTKSNQTKSEKWQQQISAALPYSWHISKQEWMEYSMDPLPGGGMAKKSVKINQQINHEWRKLPRPGACASFPSPGGNVGCSGDQ